MNIDRIGIFTPSTGIESSSECLEFVKKRGGLIQAWTLSPELAHETKPGIVSDDILQELSLENRLNKWNDLKHVINDKENITLTKNEGVPTRAKYDRSVSQDINNVNQIPFHKTHTTDEEINSAVEAIKSGWLTMGPKTVEFENKFKEFI